MPVCARTTSKEKVAGRPKWTSTGSRMRFGGAAEGLGSGPRHADQRMQPLDCQTLRTSLGPLVDHEHGDPVRTRRSVSPRNGERCRDPMKDEGERKEDGSVRRGRD